jgi:hypothetical protein
MTEEDHEKAPGLTQHAQRNHARVAVFNVK